MIKACFMIDGAYKGLVGYTVVSEEPKYYTISSRAITLFYPDGLRADVLAPDHHYVILDEGLVNFGKFGPQDKEE